MCGHLEILHVTLRAAKGLTRRAQRSFASLRMTTRTRGILLVIRQKLRSFASLRMTARTALESAHRNSYLQISVLRVGCGSCKILQVGLPVMKAGIRVRERIGKEYGDNC